MAGAGAAETGTPAAEVLLLLLKVLLQPLKALHQLPKVLLLLLKALHQPPKVLLLQIHKNSDCRRVEAFPAPAASN